MAMFCGAFSCSPVRCHAAWRRLSHRKTFGIFRCTQRIQCATFPLAKGSRAAPHAKSHDCPETQEIQRFAMDSGARTRDVQNPCTTMQYGAVWCMVVRCYAKPIGFKIQCPQGRVGSSPTFGTSRNLRAQTMFQELTGSSAVQTWSHDLSHDSVRT